MTNAEKYLKDGVVAEELWKTFRVYYYKNKNKESDVEKAFRSFFEQKAKPTLTEDERVILMNIKKSYTAIKRTEKTGLLQLWDADFGYWAGFEKFNHLFQFIKERRRI